MQKLTAEDEANKKAAAEKAIEEAAKQAALAALLAKSSTKKALQPVSPKLQQLQATKHSQNTQAPEQSSPWGGSELKPTPQPQPSVVKMPSAAVFKSTPPPPSETVSEAPSPATKKSVLGSAFAKRPNGSI